MVEEEKQSQKHEGPDESANALNPGLFIVKKSGLPS
jgi:hypothetical protein